MIKSLGVIAFTLSSGSLFGLTQQEIQNTQNRSQMLSHPEYLIPGPRNNPMAISPALTATIDVFQVWEVSEWKNYEKLFHIYDAKSVNIEALLQSDHGYTGIFTNDVTSKFLYDSKGVWNEQLDYSWDGEKWGASSRIWVIYNSSGKQASSTDFYWNGQSFDTTGRQLSTYDGSGNITRYLEQTWQPSGFQDSKQTTNVSAGKTVTYTTQIKNNGTWENTQRWIYNYSANNALTNIMQQDWSLTQWVDHENMVYTYRGNQTDLEYLLWNEASGKWDHEWFLTWTYVSGLLVTFDEKKVFTGTDYGDYIRYTYTYGNPYVGISKNNRFLNQNTDIRKNSFGTVGLISPNGSKYFDLRGKTLNLISDYEEKGNTSPK